MPSLRTPTDLADLRLQVLAERRATPVWITVCTGTGCCAYGAEALAAGFEKEIEQRGLDAPSRNQAHGLPRLLRTWAAGRHPTEGDLLPARSRERYSGDRGQDGHRR